MQIKLANDGIDHPRDDFKPTLMLLNEMINTNASVISPSLLGLLAGLSGIRAGWVIETKSRLGAE